MEKLKALFNNKKFLKIFYIVLALVVALSIFLYFQLSKEKDKVKLVNVKRGNIAEVYEASAIIESGGQISYTILNGTKPTKLNVEVGDGVKKGEVLATFDTSGVDSLIEQKKREYNDANLKYQNAVETIQKANSEIAEVNTKIEELENIALQLQGKTGKSISGDGKQQMSIEELKAILDAIGGGGSVLTEEQLNSLYEQIEEGGGKVYSDYGNSDIQKIISSGSSTDTQLLSIQLQISMLNSQKEMLSMNNSQTMLDTYKSLRDATKLSLENVLQQKEELEKGWIAQSDGVITELNISEGETYTASQDFQQVSNNDLLSILEGLSSNDINIDALSNQINSAKSMSTGIGLVQDSYEDYSASFKIGKYEMQKISVNMPAKVSFLNHKYNGYVSYISAKAQNSSSGISAITGTGSISSNKLTAKVTIKNPDENLVVGFDVKISLNTEVKEDVLLIPIEALIVNAKEKYVYVYDENTDTVKKRNVEVGISSDEFYEIKSGLKENEKVAKNLSEMPEKGAEFYVGE